MKPMPSDCGLADCTLTKAKRFIRDHIKDKSEEQILQDRQARMFLDKIGPDTSINAFACNFKKQDGTWNSEITETNKFNECLFDRLSYKDLASVMVVIFESHCDSDRIEVTLNSRLRRCRFRRSYS